MMYPVAFFKIRVAQKDTIIYCYFFGIKIRIRSLAFLSLSITKLKPLFNRIF